VGFAMSIAVYERRFLQGYTRQNRLAGFAYGFLWNKYYLDWLYEKVIVAFVSGPLGRASYWVNMKIIDKAVDSVGTASVEVGEWVYGNVDQGVVDGIVNGAGEVAEGAGEALRPVQSGRVQQYGALLFSAAAVGALVLVIVVV
jgi:NADH-quinone oxidoreductase subunit L